MSVYFTPDDVLFVPGSRAAVVWGAYSTQQQTTLITRVCARVDRITRQSGGLLKQTDKTAVITPMYATDTLFLPNTPVTAVSAIDIVGRGGGSRSYLCDSDHLVLSGGQSMQYRITDTSLSPTVGVFWPDDDVPFAEGDTVTVTYTCGYDTAPEDLKEGCILLLLASYMGVTDNPSGALSLSQGGAHVSFGHAGVVNPTLNEALSRLEPFMCVPF